MSIETKSYDNKNRGAFFLENDSEVLWSGNLEFSDGVKHYGKIIKSVGKGNREKLEVCISLGMVYDIPEEEKKDPSKSPDIAGRVKYGRETFKFGSWKKQAESGLDYLSVSLNEISENDEAPF